MVGAITWICMIIIFLLFKALHGQKMMYMYDMLCAIMADSDQL